MSTDNTFEAFAAPYLYNPPNEPSYPPMPLRRRNSLAVLEGEGDEEDDYEEPEINSPILWRRTSLDAGLPPRLRHQPKAKEESEMEYIPEKRSVRKRSFSEDIEEGEESESEEEKPKKYKAKRTYKGRRGKGKLFECAGKDHCLLCKNGAPYYLQKSMNPGWRETLLAVFEYFHKRVTYRSWITSQPKSREGELSGDDDLMNKEHVADVEWLFLPEAYGFLEYHWDILCPPQHKNRAFTGTNWRKTLQDTLSHNRTYFISGKELFGKTGFWRLSENVPVQNGLYEKTLGELKFKQQQQQQQGSRPPSMFTIDAILKRAEEQGQIPIFSANNQVQKMEEEPTKKVPVEANELDILISAIDQMHSSGN